MSRVFLRGESYAWLQVDEARCLDASERSVVIPDVLDLQVRKNNDANGVIQIVGPYSDSFVLRDKRLDLG